MSKREKKENSYNPETIEMARSDKREKNLLPKKT